MELDKSLLKDFAKVINKPKEKPKETLVKGTIKKNTGGKYVQLDGAPTVTPISGVVDVDEGDRVLVSIENHKAVIVGNYTFPPSARKEQEALDQAGAAQNSANNANTTANAAQLAAQQAGTKADEAISKSSIASASATEAKQQAADAVTKATSASTAATEAKTLATQADATATQAKNDAAASQAASANAQAEVTRLNNEVNNAKADITSAVDKVNAQATEIAGIKNTYATKVEVGNTKADLQTEISTKVGELKTTVEQNYSTKTENVALEGKLQTQITQNATGLASQVTKTEKLEADTAKAQQDVANALAKSATAQTAATEAKTIADNAKLAADKATADAKTATDKAVLAQTAADTAKAAANAADLKVQSAQNDLNTAKQNLTNVTSRVDATEKDIADAQAKVDAAQTAVNGALADAAEANLAASKAQQAADKAQLDATQAQGTASTAQQKAENAQTAATNAQAAADKAQKDVAALTNRVTTAETSIKQNTDNITLNANKTTEIGTKLDNLKIGGRNLLYNSKFDKNYDKWYGEVINNKDITFVEKEGFKCACITSDGMKNSILIQDVTGRLEPNQTYVFSMYALLEEYVPVSESPVPMCEFYQDGSHIDADGKPQWFGYGGFHYNIECKNPGWNKIEYVFKTDSKLLSYKWYKIYPVFIRNCKAKVYFRDLKLEKGNRPTDWTPAPEDIESNIDGVKNNLQNNYYNKTETDAKIKVEADRISSTVTKVETVKKSAIVSSVEQFYLSTSPTALVGGSWGNTQPTWTQGKYIWRRTLLTKGDGTTSYQPNQNGVCITGNTGAQGPSGATGTAGVGISGITEYYQVSASNTTAPTSWVTTVPTMTSTNRYLWNYEKITYTNGTSKDTAKRVIGVYGDKGNTGEPGKPGAAGRGVRSITNYYLATNTSSGVTSSTSGWTTTVQSVSADKKYLWSYEKVMYTDNSALSSAPHIIGAYGDKGAQGPQGVQGVAGKDGINYWRSQGKIDLSDTTKFNVNKWYPVVGSPMPTTSYNRIVVYVALEGASNKPSWSTHSAGFSVNLDISAIGSGWGTTSGENIIYGDTCSYCQNWVSPASFMQIGQASTPVLYLRGGGKYNVKTDFGCVWKPYPEGYTWQSGSHSATAPVKDSRPAVQGRNIKGPEGPQGKPGSNGISLAGGRIIHKDITFDKGLNECQVYNHMTSTKNYVTIERAARSADNPYSHAQYEMMVKSTGRVDPAFGGYMQRFISRPNAIFVRRIIAKIPQGRAMAHGTNPMGDGYTVKWLTPYIGTGNFEEYMIQYNCGPTGTFSTGGFIYITGGKDPTPTEPLIWYVASSETYDMTSVPIDPEDLATNNDLNNINQNLTTQVTKAQSSIDQLADQITHLIVDENGSSMMTQTPDGWRFDMSSITGNLNAVKDELKQVNAEQGKTNTLVNNINSTVDALNKKTAYIDVTTTADGKPQMSLGTTSSGFKLNITNESIDFMDGSNRVAYASNNKFYAPQMVTVNSIQIGEAPGFKWEMRPNGHLGLVYIEK